MTKCSICYGSGSMCYKCEVIYLKNKVYRLEEYIRKKKYGSNPILMFPDIIRQQIHNFFRFTYDMKKMNYDKNKQYSFTTITFDPSKFGYHNQPDHEKDYILASLRQLYVSDILEEVTGCFEYHKSGQVHAHMLIKSDYHPSYIDKALTPFFTDNKKNTIAVKSYPAKFDRDEEYITKESTEYFSHLDDLDKGVFHDLPKPIKVQLEKVARKEDKDVNTVIRENKLLSETRRRQQIAT